MMTDKVFTTQNFEGERRSIPLPIQTYFWRQTSQLLKPKLVRRNYESACVSFERIICENKIQDLQPSLASAVKSINRWHLIQSSVPYILQCCSKLLSNRCRMGNVERLGNAERELLYTLHWILLEGPRVCCVVDSESLLYPQTIIEQFVHVLIPHVYSMRENDLTFRLENGMAIWGPLWKHETPLLVPFTSKVLKIDTGNQAGSLVGQSQSGAESDPDFTSSTFFDVAVLKCLSSSGWAEDGVVWALRYLAQYLKREFDLPDDIVSRESSVSNIPVYVSPGQSICTDATPLDAVVKKSSSHKEPTDNGLLRNTDEALNNDKAEGLNEGGEQSECVCQTADKNSESTAKQGLAISKGVEKVDAAVSFGVTDTGDKTVTSDGISGSYKQTSEDRDTMETDRSSDERTGKSGLERSGSIKLRIRLQSSPLLSQGGRVITAVASPSTSPVQYDSGDVKGGDSLQNTSDIGTFQNTKVYIQPSSTLQSPPAEKSGLTIQGRDGLSLDVKPDEGKPDAGLKSEPKLNLLGGVPDGQAMTVLEGDGDVQESTRNSDSSSSAFESAGGEESPHAEASVNEGNPGSVLNAMAYKHLSERPSSSQASSSSGESESQPLLNSSKRAQEKSAPVSVLEPFDTPRTSIGNQQDSVMKVERYFVFPGTADYITTDGRLSILMILKALNSLLRDNPTSRICQASLTILRYLLTIHEGNKSQQSGSSEGYDDRTVAETQAVGFRSPHSENVLGRLRASFYGRPPSFLSLAMGCLVSLVKSLGCPLGCGEGCRGITGDRLRNLSNDLLSQLFRTDQREFKSWIQQFARLEPHEDLVDFLHALVGFCEDDQEQSDDEMTLEPKHKKQKNLFNVPEGVNSVIIGGVFKTLLSRVAEMNFRDLKNLTFYGELRQLLRFVKENYGGVFWKVALSGLLDSAFKEPKDQTDANKVPEQDTLTRGAVGKVQRKETKIAKVERTITYRTKRKFLQKFGRVTTESSDSGSTSLSKLSSVVDSPSVEMALSPRSKRKIFTLGTWRKQKTVGTPFGSVEDLLDSESTSEQTSTAKRKHLKTKSASRKKLEDIFPISRKIPDGTPSEQSLPIDIVVQEFETKPVDVEALRAGMVRFRFLLHGCQPGSVPDPKIVASMLDLEAPAIARASLLLECCLLVNMCNQGEWPQWLRASLPSLAHRRGGHSPSGASPFMFAQRRNLVAMHEAGVLFRAWGVALGKKLEQVLAKHRRNILPSIEEEGGKPVLGDEEDIEEDFLDEATLSESVKVCPYPLLMIACQLLLEITSFLRESHGLYSVTKPTYRPLHRYIVPRRRQSVTSYRRSIVLSPETQQRRLSSLIGGGGERIRRASVLSQASVQTEFNSSPSRTLQEPPMITVSETDPGSTKLEAPDQEEKRERRDSTGQAGNRSSLYFPRQSAQHSPKTAKRIARRSAIGGEGESVRFRSKSTKCGSKHLSVDANVVDDDDESDDEDPTANLPWLSAVIQLNSLTAFLCDHQGVCHLNCHQRQSRSCTRMVQALKTVYSSPNKLDKIPERGLTKVVSSALISAPQMGSAEQVSLKQKDDEEMRKYISSNISSLTHCPFSVIAKAGTVIETEHLLETLPVAWELLLDEDQQLVSSAASVFLLTAVRLRDTVEQMLHKELVCADANDRVKSLQRFEVLWQSRYHAWPRLQEGARLILKVPPPKIDFTLPSPAVGMASTHPPDCPWDARLLLEEQQEQKKNDTKKVRDSGNELKRKQERIEYLMRAVPVSMEATVGVNVAEDEKGESQQVDAELWPQAVSSSIPDIIKMMDDIMVDSEKVAVMEVARRLVWRCLVDDPVLFFRTILEQFTKKDKQEEHVSLIRKLLLYITELPPTSSRFLINNLIGVAMYYARTNKPGNQDSLALVLSLLWQAVPSVRGFLFKDLKQCLRKEHCDNALRVSSNVPGAKKLCVILPDQDNNDENEEDREKTKETVPVHDEMTFGKVLESFKSRLQSAKEDQELYLIDKKSDQILEERYHVRDVYTQRKGFPSPLLLLEFLDQEFAFNKRQAQAFTAKIAEIGRVLLTSSMLNALPNQKHISFLHGEFSRQISFPRKALDCDFSLYAGGSKGRELAALDVIHKSVWVKLITSLFQCMSTDFPWGSADLNLFLNVINGAILLHCEDAAVLRLCLGAFVNIAVHFSNIFASNGYQYIFPSLLQVYSHHETNEMVTTAIEFAMKQFYILHQKPCLLQLFASVAPILLVETRADGDEEEAELEDLSGKIPSKCLFSLLASLDRPSPDSLEVLDLVRAEKPLKPMDSCYESSTDPPGVSQVDTAVRLCVTVVNFAPESKRAVQMVIVLSAILPHYLAYLKTENSFGDNDDKLKTEFSALTSLVTSINVLVKSSEVLTRSFIHFQSYKSISDKSGIFPDLASTTSLMFGRGSFSSVDAPSNADEVELGRGRPFLERLRAQEEKDEVMQALDEYRKPRDALLILVSDYIRICAPRLEELEEALPPRHTIPELLDSISVNTLSEIVYSLLKLAVYDPVTLSCFGLKRYMTEALPLLKGSPEALETAMLLILKRVNKMFEKLVNKPDLMRCIDWKALEFYLKGLYSTLCKRASVAHSPYMKTLVTICISLVLQERASAAVSVAANLPFAPILSPPQFFADTVIKLASRLMHVMKEQCSLKELCGNSINFGSPSRTEKIFVRLILPTCIRLGSGRTDAPKASLEDVIYALNCFLTTVTTKKPETPSSSPMRLSFADDFLDLPRSLTFAVPHEGKTAYEEIPQSLYCAAYLGLKILIVCFEDRLATEWYRIYQALETVVDSRIGNVGFWDFMNFCVSYRTPLYLLTIPLIRTKVVQLRHTSAVERALKQRVMDKISQPPLMVNCRNALIAHFVTELSAIKQKRPAVGLQDVDEEGKLEEEEEQKEEKTLTLKPPPSGRERSCSAPEEPATKGQTEEGKPSPIIVRSASMKAKKSVSFSPAPSFDEDQGSMTSSLTDVGKEKRKKRLLRKQDTVEEQETQTGNSLLEVDSSGGSGPFGHQRGATLRPGRKLSKRLEKFRAAAATVIAERKLSTGLSRSSSVDTSKPVESKSKGIVEVCERERFEMEAFVADDYKPGAVFEQKQSQESLKPPIAKPESVKISLSPYGSPLRRSPVEEEGMYPDVLEAITPLPPVPPVKFSSHVDEKHESNSINARNGSVAPETNLTAEYDVERAQRLSRTRWWQKVYASVDISTTEEDTQRLHIATSDELEIQRETNV
ncbi:unnamed protein product [Porites evermanni]|uniref:Protein unc-80 homolog n=1 Tax=Porites evermanni TaxID=104178 RepID=A0ABN8LTJ2_9CNID|nr:unnamed protein product [Porites evermanni]